MPREKLKIHQFCKLHEFETRKSMLFASLELLNRNFVDNV